jgi:hypothetical protein
MNTFTTIAMTIGPCAANRHQVCGPADRFPPACDSCAREALEADADRYRYLREHLGLGFAVNSSLYGGSIPGPTLLDLTLDKARGAVNGTG